MHTHHVLRRIAPQADKEIRTTDPTLNSAGQRRAVVGTAPPRRTTPERFKEMIRKRAENGSFYHEPPYTEEEELMLYRHGPVFKMLHPVRPSASATAHPPARSQDKDDRRD